MNASSMAASVTEQVDLAVAPAKAWDTVRNFLTWQAWHPAFLRTVLLKGEGNTVGSVRLLTTKDGAEFTEELMLHDAPTQTCQYRILKSPAPVEGYLSTLQVKPRSGGCTVVWSSVFTVGPGTSPQDAKQAIAGIYRAGLNNLASLLQ